MDESSQNLTPVMHEAECERARDLSIEKIRPPTTAPGYARFRFLGKGAYGEVWLAEDANTGRKVAVKFYNHRGGVDWSMLSREVEKLRFLETDRHVVQLLKVGWDADPPYYVMEYLSSGSLETRLQREHALPVADAVAVIREVATGLLHAHDKGILHCDLKPANILLDQDGKPRLADFGQSRLSYEQDPALGTLFYMAPEQADLKASPNARWDVYALGAVFFEMITGHAPYRTVERAAEIQGAGSLIDRLQTYRRILQEAKPPSQHKRVPGVDRGLADIIDKCLAIQPNSRYANVQAFLYDLQQWSLRKARKPLLILGALGPLLILLVLASVAWRAFSLAIDESKDAVIQRALESNRFAAIFVADQFALEIDKRWRILEEAADNKKLKTKVKEIAAFEVGSPQYAKAQEWIQRYVSDLAERYRGEFQWKTNVTSWFVNDIHGRQVAREPPDPKTLHRSWSHRDYFHGEGFDYRPDDPDVKKLKPSNKTRRSVMFRSRATGTMMVAFAAPIRQMNGEPPPDGILATTVELADFGEFQGSGEQFAVIIDTRADSNNKKPGLVIVHPNLYGKKPDPKNNSFYYVDKEVVQRAERIKAKYIPWLEQYLKNPGDANRAPMDFLQLTHYAGDYRDPVPGYRNAYWSAALIPVVANRGPDDIRDTGWAVIVQERYDATVQPVVSMRTKLVWWGIAALCLVAVVLLTLWGFVVLLHSEVKGPKWLQFLRRRAGIAPTEISAHSATPTPESLGLSHTVQEETKIKKNE